MRGREQSKLSLAPSFFLSFSLSRSLSLSIQKTRLIVPVRLPGPRGELAVVLPEPAARVDGEADFKKGGEKENERLRSRRRNTQQQKSVETEKSAFRSTALRLKSPLDTEHFQLRGKLCSKRICSC